MTEGMNPGGLTPMYDEYCKYLLQITKKLEIFVAINTPARKANSSETDYLSQNSPSDPEFNQVSDLSDYIGVQDADFV